MAPQKPVQEPESIIKKTLTGRVTKKPCKPKSNLGKLIENGEVQAASDEGDLEEREELSDHDIRDDNKIYEQEPDVTRHQEDVVEKEPVVPKKYKFAMRLVDTDTDNEIAALKFYPIYNTATSKEKRWMEDAVHDWVCLNHDAGLGHKFKNKGEGGGRDNMAPMITAPVPGASTPKNTSVKGERHIRKVFDDLELYHRNTSIRRAVGGKKKTWMT